MAIQEESTARLNSMPGPEECSALLERVAASSQLKRSARLQELLFYIGKRYLRDGCDRLHEQEIGAQVFKRPESYDTNLDNIVRTNVSDLRKRMDVYFQTEGLHEPLIVEIPRGGYIPVFRNRVAEAIPAASVPSDNDAGATDSPAPASNPEATPWRRFWMPAALIASAVLIVALATGCALLWYQLSTLRHSLFAWQFKPSVAAFWSEFLNANSETDLVMSDAGIGIVQALSQQTFPLDQYLNHGYVEKLQEENLSPDMHGALNRIMAWNLASPDEFSLARRIMALDLTGKKLHLYNARNYMPDLINQNNVILIGARRSNPWDELFDSRLNFITEFDNRRVVNRVPAPGELPVYPTSDSVGYCVVAYLPKSEQGGSDLLIEGTNAEATEAAGNFLLSEDQLSNFKQMLHVTKLPYFQVLLKVSSVRGTPFTATVQAYRVLPQTH
jgi:hypothetical protein